MNELRQDGDPTKRKALVEATSAPRPDCISGTRCLRGERVAFALRRLNPNEIPMIAARVVARVGEEHPRRTAMRLPDRERQTMSSDSAVQDRLRQVAF